MGRMRVRASPQFTKRTQGIARTKHRNATENKSRADQARRLFS
jgi:hypothetical protein